MITEKDIFNYVFYKDKLDQGRIAAIKKNLTYKETLNFYSSLKDELKKELQLSTRRKLSAKIPDYKLQNTYWLHQSKSSMENDNKESFIDSEGKKVLETRTFFDDEKKFIIKWADYGEYSTLFVFSMTEPIIENFTLTCLPDKIVVKVKNNNEPIKFTTKVDIESIELKFENEE